MIGWLYRMIVGTGPSRFPQPKPPPIRIAGIYVICRKLGLPKCDEPSGKEQRRMIVAMESGRDAVYIYQEFETASNVDWGWHRFAFQRYALPTDANLPRYS